MSRFLAVRWPKTPWNKAQDMELLNIGKITCIHMWPTLIFWMVHHCITENHNGAIQNWADMIWGASGQNTWSLPWTSFEPFLGHKVFSDWFGSDFVNNFRVSVLNELWFFFLFPFAVQQLATSKSPQCRLILTVWSTVKLSRNTNLKSTMTLIFLLLITGIKIWLPLVVHREIWFCTVIRVIVKVYTKGSQKVSRTKHNL